MILLKLLFEVLFLTLLALYTMEKRCVQMGPTLCHSCHSQNKFCLHAKIRSVDLFFFPKKV